MTPPKLAPLTLERLTFVRLLYQQAAEQSRLPEPLRYTCILTFHDAIELFLLLASEHVSAAVPEQGASFTHRYFSSLNKRLVQLGMSELSMRKAVDRITEKRNAFKHAFNMPVPHGVEESLGDARGFLEDNCPKVFGVEFDAIDMANLVPQEQAKGKIKEAAASWEAGDGTTAMALLVAAFDLLFNEHVGSGHAITSPFSFGRDNRRPLRSSELSSIFVGHDCHTHHGNKGQVSIKRADRRGAERAGEQIEIMMEATELMRNAMRIMSVGIDYHRYVRFDHLTPRIWFEAPDKMQVRAPDDYAPTSEDFGYCQQFVIMLALRLAEVEEHLQAPSWRPEANWRRTTRFW